LSTSPIFFEYLFSGLVLGLLYSLMALGISFIYGVMKMINWAMGEFYMLAGYIMFLLTTITGGKMLFPLIPTSLAAIFLIGFLLQRFVLKPMFTTLGERKDEFVIIVTLSISVFLKSLMVGLAGPYIYKVPDYLPNIPFDGFIISGNRVLAGAAALSAIILFFLLLKYTWVGRALRATAQDRLAAQSLGINVWNIDNYAFAIGVSLAGVAGVMLAPVYMVYPESGVVPAVKGFVILVMGGLGSLTGSLIGGIILGLAESLGTALIDPRYREVYGFLLMIIVLAVKPRGLFGRVEREV
jgi:branched-chain amino acid transport system permease protein